MTTDLSRRGILGLLTSAATAIRSPGEAIIKHAMGAATATVAATAPDQDHALCSSAPMPLGATSPLAWARQSLSERAWGNGLTVEHIRPSVACFRSASPVARERFERTERAREAQTRDLARIALDLLNDGKITL